MNIKILLSRNCVLSMFHDNLYRRKNKRKTKKKNFICTFLHHMLKYAKFVEYVAIPGTCIYMHQTIFFFCVCSLLIKSSTFFTPMELHTLKRNIQMHKNLDSSNDVIRKQRINTTVVTFIAYAICVIRTAVVHTPVCPMKMYRKQYNAAVGQLNLL